MDFTLVIVSAANDPGVCIRINTATLQGAYGQQPDRISSLGLTLRGSPPMTNRPVQQRTSHNLLDIWELLGQTATGSNNFVCHLSP